MKKNMLYLLMAVIVLAMGTSCEKEDDIRNVSPEFTEALNSMYPDVFMAQWERQGGYIVAEFYADGVEHNVWYTTEAVWCMTETDFGRSFDKLPEPVQEAFKGSVYGNGWNVDDIDKYERVSDTFYLIEVEKRGERDRDLYYSPDGVLLKDDYDRGDVLPTVKF